MDERCSYDDSRAKVFRNEECPRWNPDATMTFCEDGEEGAYTIAFVSKSHRGVAEGLRLRTKAGSDENDKDGRDSHAHPSIIIITGITSRWSSSCGRGSSCGLIRLASHNIGYMLHGGHFDPSVANAANTRVGEFADPGLATCTLMILHARWRMKK